ncbi:MAG: DNA polymerase III subunit gamma/tau [Acidobacteria bacterium]|nr:DNA polymerase III subunit gamma/tau [Acidobacteriota bacterium]
MSYQVLARKWRPQRFDDVVGQDAVTRTLRNALTSGRIAHAFVFAGSRGCGKTTTARILARALNCVQGPTADPCGTCDACQEIAQGRDIDVLEIDAASHTGVDNIREVVIAGLSIMPVRDRYKVFIIDEVHQLSGSSFNALLKSIEEPPPHVVFMMATTELHKIPDTILSRSQVFEFRTIPSGLIVAQLRRIADAETLDVSDAALALIARAAEGSMRDAQSALDQVMAFAGAAITEDDVSTVLGLVGRDLLFDVIDAVVAEDASGAFAIADRAVESGHDLRLVCRELARLVRDLMVVSIDPARAGDPDVGGGDGGRLAALATQFSREDLLRAFDVLARAEQEIRSASHPRYHFEMVLLRWMHLRKLVPLTELLEQLGSGAAPGAGRIERPSPGAGAAALPTAATGRTVVRPAPGARGPAVPPATSASAPMRPSTTPAGEAGAGTGPGSGPGSGAASSAGASGGSASVRARAGQPSRAPSSGVEPRPAAGGGAQGGVPQGGGVQGGGVQGGALKDALLAEIRAGKGFFYNTVVAQAQRIEVAEGQVTFTFLPAHRALRGQFDQTRPWLEAAAERLAGRKVQVTAVQAEGPSAADAAAEVERDTPEAGPAGPRRDLKAEALSSTAVQAVLEVFPAEIKDVEEV